MDRRADAAATALFGYPVDVRFSAPRLAVSGLGLVSVGVDDVSMVRGQEADAFTKAGSLTFGLRLLPLLRGRMEFGSAAISDAKLDFTDLAKGKGSLDDEDGLIDGGKLLDAVYGGVRQIDAALSRSRAAALSLENVTLVLPGAVKRELAIGSLTLDRSAEGLIALKGSARLDGKNFELAGSASVDAASGKVSAFKVSAASENLNWPGAGIAAPASATFTEVRGAISAVVQGSQLSAGERLAVRLTGADAAIKVYNGDVTEGGFSLLAALQRGSGKLEIEELAVDAGRTRLRFHGALGPMPSSERTDEPPSYRFELISDGSVVEVDDAGEAPMPVIAQVKGQIIPDSGRFSIKQFNVRTASGDVFGSASLTTSKSGAPSVYLELSVPEMAVSDAKQLWPAGIAVRARAWVVSRIFGGVIHNGRIQLAVGPNRLFTGTPLNPDEVSGHFEVERARVDIAGTLPPLRDSVGTIDFRGSNVDVALASGTVFMPTSRTVGVKEGTFIIRNAHIWPVYGALDIKVAGDAPAILELSSYEPINALQYLKLAPEDLSGTAQGTVRANIPLGKDFSKGADWDVGLAYSGLSIAKEFAGQKVSDADGSIRILPQKALIKADAKLNGLQASLDLVEPLKAGSEVKRVRDIKLQMDDKARNAFAPGLSALLKGPIAVALQSGAGAKQAITADLTKARLSIPWVGWSKGAGIPAKAAFDMEKLANGQTKLSNFVLSGESFALNGTIIVSGANLVSAQLDKVRLNRGDQASVAVTRDGKGYAVKIGGKSFDARALVKAMLSEDRAAPGASTSVKLSADLESLTGFNDENLSGVSVSYSGTGSSVGALKVAASSKTGGAVAIAMGSEDGKRIVKMKSADAGAILRFLDIYDKMRGGSITLDLAAKGDGPLTGQIDARDFLLVNEPRLKSVVTSSKDENGKSIRDIAKGEVDVSKVKFERGYTRIEKGGGALKLEEGILRGPVIGASFQGSLYDKAGNMNMTGVFMPAYGLNRIFGELPVIGEILGNGRDKGLLGITFRLEGDAKEPNLHVNPMSLIAPGIFRQIFEYR